MSDIVDDAQEAMEIAEQLRQQLRQQAARQFKPIRTGSCIECGEPTKFTFCSVDCRDNHARIERIQAIIGG